MNSHVLVIPYEESLLGKLRGAVLVVRTEDDRLVPEIAGAVGPHNHLHAIWLRSTSPLSDIVIADAWEHIPVALYLPGLGDFQTCMLRVPFLRQLNVRIFLSAHLPENLTAVRMLSSLGVHCGLWLQDGPVDWEGVNDVMNYSIYTKTNHAPIEPFHYLAANYRRENAISFGPVYFNDPRKYLHLDRSHRIALSDQDLEYGEFVAEGLDSLATLADNERYLSALNNWQSIFQKPDGCAYCAAWRVCMGGFASSYVQNPEAPECRRFFNDLLEAAEFFQTQQGKKGNALWQF